MAGARRLSAGPLLLFLIAAALAACGGSRQHTTSGEANRFNRLAKRVESIPVTAHVEPRLVAAFAILKGQPEELPSVVQHALDHHVFGINVKLARRIPVGLVRTSFWLLPGNRHLCIVSLQFTGPAVSTICETTAYAILHGIASVSIGHPYSPDPERTIVGIAPNTAQRALIHTDGSTSVAAIHNEIFRREDGFGKPPDSITLDEGQSN